MGETVDTGKERYGMNWPGKADCFKTIQQPSIATLVPARDESIDFDNTENLFIEGDNLEVLKLLQKSYLGKVKMIYIDPPYNTGNDFVYPDDYAQSLQNYMAFTGQVDAEGRSFSTNKDTNGRFHSDWLNMMYPRIFLAKNLLREDGVIFISIDDHEIYNLRSLCNRNTTGVSIDHEYILCFSKNSDIRAIRGSDRKTEQYSNPDNDPRGDWASGNMVGLLSEDLRPNCHYDLVDPKTQINYGRPKMGWRYEKKTMLKLIEEDRILWPNSEEGRPRRKVFLSDISDILAGYSSIVGENIYTRNGTAEIDEIFNLRCFDFPKSSLFIKDFVKQTTSYDKSEIILDFFAGSATTAHAVMELNKEDGGNRKYICVQIPEPTEEKSEAYKAGYKNIAEISKERIRRVSANIKKEQDEKELKESGSLFYNQNNQDNQLNQGSDIGFKVFKLDHSNFKIWDATLEKEPEAIQQRLFEHIDHISPEAAQEAILYELLLKSGFELTKPIEKLILAEKIVFSIAGGQLLICLEKELSHDCIKAMAELQPTRVICLDEAFTGTNADALKTNAVQIMKSKGVVNFRTV